MRIPDWWEFALLALASWRTFQLFAFDDILNRPRRKLLQLARDWEEGDDLPDEYRLKWAQFITCVYCAGFWISVAWWGAWELWPHATIVFATPWALSAIVIGGHKILSKEEDR